MALKLASVYRYTDDDGNTHVLQPGDDVSELPKEVRDDLRVQGLVTEEEGLVEGPDGFPLRKPRGYLPPEEVAAQEYRERYEEGNPEGPFPQTNMVRNPQSHNDPRFSQEDKQKMAEKVAKSAESESSGQGQGQGQKAEQDSKKGSKK